MEGPAQTGEGCEAAAPARTAAAGNTAVSGMSAPEGLRARHVLSAALRCDGCIRRWELVEMGHSEFGMKTQAQSYILSNVEEKKKEKKKKSST